MDEISEKTEQPSIEQKGKRALHYPLLDLMLWPNQLDPLERISVCVGLMANILQDLLEKAKEVTIVVNTMAHPKAVDNNQY